MINVPLLYGTIGIAVSAILVFCSILIPRWFVSAGVRELDRVRFGTRVLSERESVAFGVLMHLLLSFFFGAAFGALMQVGVVAFDVFSLFVFYVAMSLIIGGILLPLEGHGWFGWKEDHWLSVDLLAMNAVWIFLFWALVAALM